MIEWIIAVGISIGFSIAIYFVSFSILMILSKNVKSMGIALKNRPWISNIIIGPVIISLSLLSMYLFTQGDFTSWGFQGVNLFEFSIFFSSSAFIAAFTVGFTELLSPTPVEMKPPEDLKSRILFFLLIVILASISEELLFRGFLQGFVDSSYLLSIELGMLVITSGGIISAIVFAIVHAMPAKRMGTNPKVLVGASLILGVIASISLSTTGSLVTPIAIHVLFNLAGFLESLFPISKGTIE